MPVLTMCRRCNLPMVYPCDTDEREDRCLNTKLPPVFQVIAVVSNGVDPQRIEWRSKTIPSARRAIKLAQWLMLRRANFVTYAAVPAGMGWAHRLPSELTEDVRPTQAKATDSHNRIPKEPRRRDRQRRVRSASVPQERLGVGDQEYAGA